VHEGRLERFLGPGPQDELMLEERQVYPLCISGFDDDPVGAATAGDLEAGGGARE
jgi:hypothetical protein